MTHFTPARNRDTVIEVVALSEAISVENRIQVEIDLLPLSNVSILPNRNASSIQHRKLICCGIVLPLVFLIGVIAFIALMKNNCGRKA